MKNFQNTIAIIPVKKFTNSKLRLSNILTSNEREKLSYFMLCDVIKTMEEVDKIKEIIITTPMIQDIDVSEFPKVKIFHDNSSDINVSLKNSINHCKKLDNDLILIIPSDIPLIEKRDFENIFHQKQKSRVQILISPSNRFDGTNLMLFDSNLDLKTYFGNNSFRKHKKEYDSKYSLYIYKSFRIGLDIDYESDLKILYNSSVSRPRRSQAYLREIDIHI